MSREKISSQLSVVSSQESRERYAHDLRLLSLYIRLMLEANRTGKMNMSIDDEMINGCLECIQLKEAFRKTALALGVHHEHQD
jgi:hypothetical protein